MDWSPSSPPVPAELGDVTVVGPLAANVWRLRGPDGDLVLKAGPGVSDEAAGLRRLASVSASLSGSVAGDGRRRPAVPAVVWAGVWAGGDVLVTAWVEPGPRTAASEAELGRGLARLHSAPADAWGGGSSWIGACRVDPSTAPDAAGFYGRRLSDLAARCGLTAVVEPLTERLPRLIPPGPAAVVHGDLWWGNVLWGAGDRPWLIDPSVHGGHPEEDLAMLALFGSVPDRVLGAYRETRPLDDGWPERTALWQLYPLLVHTVLFGGGYRASAEAAARRYL